jgi:hypothetical protein
MTSRQISPRLHRSSSLSDLGPDPQEAEGDNGATATCGAREPLAFPFGFSNTAAPAPEGLTTTAPTITTQVSRKLQRRTDREHVDINLLIFEMRSGNLAIDTLSAYSEQVRFELLDGFTKGRHRTRINTGKSIEEKLVLIAKFAISSPEYMFATCYLLTETGPQALRLFARCRPADPAVCQFACDCAQTSKEDAQDIAREFAGFAELRLHDEKSRFEIAKACFLSDPEAASRYLPNFNLTAPQRISLLISAAGIIPKETALQLVHFQLPELDKQKVLLACARCPESEIADNFEKLEIDDEAFTFELIKACIIAGRACDVARSFKSYALKSPEYTRSLLMLCAKNNGEFTLEYIDNFGVEDFDYLGEVGLVCARQNGDAAAHFSKLGARDLEYKLRFARACAEGASAGWRAAGQFRELAIPPGSVTEKVLHEIALA